MARPWFSKEKIVFAPMRVIVLSAAVNSVRDCAPVRTRSGAFTRSLTLAGAGVVVCAGRRFTSLMISVTLLSLRAAALADGRHKVAKAQRRMIVFMVLPA